MPRVRYGIGATHDRKAGQECLNQSTHEGERRSHGRELHAVSQGDGNKDRVDAMMTASSAEVGLSPTGLSTYMAGNWNLMVEDMISACLSLPLNMQTNSLWSGSSHHVHQVDLNDEPDLIAVSMRSNSASLSATLTAQTADADELYPCSGLPARGQRYPRTW